MFTIVSRSFSRLIRLMGSPLPGWQTGGDGVHSDADEVRVPDAARRKPSKPSATGLFRWNSGCAANSISGFIMGIGSAPFGGAESRGFVR